MEKWHVTSWKQQSHGEDLNVKIKINCSKAYLDFHSSEGSDKEDPNNKTYLMSTQ